MRPKPRPEAAPRGWWLELTLLLLVALTAGLGPRLVEARAAAAWARHYALADTPSSRLAPATLEAARRAGEAVERVAPLAPSGQAVSDVLGLARRLARRDPAVASQAVATLRDALARAGLRALPLRSLRGELEALMAELAAAESQDSAPSTEPEPAPGGPPTPGEGPAGTPHAGRER